MDLDAEGVVGIQDRVVLGGENPGRDLGVEGKEGVDEASGASGKSGEPVRSGLNFLEATDVRCSRSNFGRVLRVTLDE